MSEPVVSRRELLEAGAMAGAGALAAGLPDAQAARPKRRRRRRKRQVDAC